MVISANLPPFGFPNQVFILILEDESSHNGIGLLYTVPPRGKDYQKLQGIGSETVLAEHVIGHPTILLLYILPDMSARLICTYCYTPLITYPPLTL